ncbi:glutathione S-transferase family protein [Xanthobacter sp. TB0139]|uniref:glutathione S-transferase family protein n=1 Tax=Xanthobacter sp. TB0139 TaxID=3459178 RepID=UPI00403A0882
MKIWGRRNSNNVRKVLWCAEELGLSYEHIEAGGAFGLVQEPAYLAMNPNGLVPCLDDNGFILWESNVIVRYLAARYGGAPFLADDMQARASAEKWMDWASTSFMPPFRAVFRNIVRATPEQRDEAAIQNGLEQCNHLMAIANQTLSAQPFLSGPVLGIGDLPLGSMAYGWFELPIARPHLPHLEAWYERLKIRPAYQSAVMTPLT